ncbi:MAG: hypothetical protein Q4F23_06515, partial [Coriobacteriia bacterium]|nr:hypothetical protein [Coriobacteriia bacterium]
IAACMYDLSRRVLDATKESAEIHKDDLPYFLRLGLCPDPTSFAMEAQALGLPMSERSARRIMDGDISAVPTHLQSFLAGGTDSSQSGGKHGASSSDPLASLGDEGEGRASADMGSTQPGAVRETSSVRFSSEDLDVLKAKVSEAFAELAQDYYLVPDVDIKLRNNRGVLQISIPLVDE